MIDTGIVIDCSHGNSLKKHEKDKDKYYLIFDKKIGENRQTYKTLCNNKLSINQNLDEFIKKINEKYL